MLMSALSRFAASGGALSIMLAVCMFGLAVPGWASDPVKPKPPTLAFNGPAAGGGYVKWNPGQYASMPATSSHDWLESGHKSSYLAQWCGSADGRRNHLGIKAIIHWGDVEPGRRGVYDWSLVDDMLATVASQCGEPKRLILVIQPKALNQFYSRGRAHGGRRCAPEWAFDAGLVAVNEKLGNAGRCAAALWDPIVKQAYMDMMAAAGARYDANPLVEAIYVTGENSIDWVKRSDTTGHTSGYSYGAWAAAEMKIIDAMAEAMPHTQIGIGSNWAIGNEAKWREQVAHCAAIPGCGLMWPDTFDKAAQGNFPHTTAHYDYRQRKGEMPLIGDHQLPHRRNPNGDAETMWDNCCNAFAEPVGNDGVSVSYHATHATWLRYGVDSTFNPESYIWAIKANGGPHVSYSSNCPENITRAGLTCRTGKTN